MSTAPPHVEPENGQSASYGRAGSLYALNYLTAGATAGQNVTALTAAIAAAATHPSKSLCFDGVDIDIDAELTLSTADLCLWASPGATARITQTNSVAGSGQRVFVINADGITIEGLDLDGNNPTLDLTGAGTLVADLDGHCAIFVNGGCDDVTLRRLTGRGFWSFVNQQATAGTSPAKNANLSIDDVEVTAVWAAVLSSGTVNLRVNNVRGTYVVPTAAPGSPYLVQGHLLYLTGDTVDLNRSMRVTNCHAYGGRGGVAYNLRYTEGMYVDQITADDCTGLVDFQNVTSLVLGSALSEADKYPVAPPAGGLGERATVAFTSCADARLGPIRIKYSAGDYGAAFFANDSSDITATDLTCDFAAATTPLADPGNHIARVLGTSTRVRLVRPRLSSSGASRDGILLSTTVGDCTVDEPAMTGAFAYGVRSSGTPTTKNTVRYDPTLMPTQPIRHASSSDTGARLINLKTNAGLTAPEVIGWHTGELLGTQSTSTAFGERWPSGQTKAGLTLAAPFTTDGLGTFTSVSSPSLRGMTANFGITDIDLRAQVKPDTGGATRAIGFCLCAVDDNNWLAGAVNGNGSVVFRKKVAGTETDLATATPAAAILGAFTDLRVAKVGSVLIMWVNGDEALRHTLAAGDVTTFGSSTNHGIFGSGNGTSAKIRAIQVRNPGA